MAYWENLKYNSKKIEASMLEIEVLIAENWSA